MSIALSLAVQRVAEARQRQAAVAATIHERRVAFEESIAWLVEEKRSAEDEVSAAEADLKGLALGHYERTQDRAPIAGVEVKLFNTMDYDPAAAFAWAKQTNLALVPEQLDRKAFEKIAGATPLDFVTYGKEPRVQIAKQLTVEAPPSETAVSAPAPATTLQEA